jgi:hypothetical protein
MPGRHGAMRYKRRKSKRQRPDQMETTLKDSIHNSRRKEQSILSELVPPKINKSAKSAVPRSTPQTHDGQSMAVLSRLYSLKASSTGVAQKSRLALAGVQNLDWASNRASIGEKKSINRVTVPTEEKESKKTKATKAEPLPAVAPSVPKPAVGRKRSVLVDVPSITGGTKKEQHSAGKKRTKRRYKRR